MYVRLLLILYLFDTVYLSEEERQYLRMIEHYYLHHCLLNCRGDHSRRAIQVTISTIAAITHTALVGSSDATSSPAEKAIGKLQLLHCLMIITSFHLTQIIAECYS